MKTVAQGKERSFTERLMDRENALLMRQSPRWLQVFAILMLLLGSGMITAGYFVGVESLQRQDN